MFGRILLPTARPYVRFISSKTSKTLTYPTNHQIPFAHVHVEGSPSSNGRPTPLNDLLSSIDRTSHLVRLVSHEPPTVKVLTHLEDKLAKLERKAEQKAKKGRSGEVTGKEVQLTWLTSDADYDHKMVAARKELERGGTRVDFRFIPKRGVRSPAQWEMKEQMDKLVTAFQDVSNEWKAPTIEKGIARVYLQSTVKTTKVLPTKEELEEQARKMLEKRERGIKRNSD